MIAYLVNIILLLFIGFILLYYKPSTTSKKVYCIFASTQWVLLSGFRHISIGADTYAYKVYNFDVIKHRQWKYLIANFVNIIFKGESGKDPGYALFEKLVQVFVSDYQIYLIIIALIFTVPLGIWVYKNSSEPCISFLIYSCLFYSFFAITGHRQTIATALVVLIGYKFIRDRKIVPFLLLVLVAYTIHKSAIGFLPFYFIANKKITKKYLAIMSAIIPFLFVMRNQVMMVLGTIMGYDSYIDQFEGAGTFTFTAIIFMLTVIAIWRLERMLASNLQVTHYINALLIALVFLPLTYVDPSAMRIVQYFSLFIMLLVPEIVKSFTRYERALVFYVAAFVLIGLFIKNNPKYLFFWQG